MDSLWQAVLDKHVPRLVRIPCERELIDSLFLTDGLHIRPSEVARLETRASAKQDDEEDHVDWEASNTRFLTEPSFPVFEQAIDAAIQELGGSVFPKLYKAPLDAAWISYRHDLCCSSADEVLTLLKCSERVSNSISELCEEDLNSLCLELREWFHVHPAGEWRCFVRDGYLLAATPRDVSCSVSLSEQDTLRVKQMLYHWFYSRTKHLRGCLVIDVYIDEQEYIWVFDVERFATKNKQNEDNLWGLFSKEEVEDLFHMQDLSQLPVIRIVDNTWSCFHSNYKKWKSGTPWELRTFSVSQAIQEAVSIFTRQQQEEDS